MKLLALVLLLLNAMFLAWARFAPEPGTLESQLLAQQVNPEAIHLLSDAQVAALGARKAEPADGASCQEWGPFNAADLRRARETLAELASQAKLGERHEDSAGWWVYIPPQASRQAATQKVTELKRLGVEDYFIVQDDPRFRFAVSLGVFSTEEAARARLDEVRGRGVRTAQVGSRQTAVQKMYLQLRDLPQALQPKLAAASNEYPGTAVKACPAP
jgi:hypothetical protein